MKMVTIHSVRDHADAQSYLNHLVRLCKRTHFGKVVDSWWLKDQNTGGGMLVTTFRTTRRKYKIAAKSKGFYNPIKGLLIPVTSMKGGR